MQTFSNLTILGKTVRIAQNEKLKALFPKQVCLVAESDSSNHLCAAGRQVGSVLMFSDIDSLNTVLKNSLEAAGTFDLTSLVIEDSQVPLVFEK